MIRNSREKIIVIFSILLIGFIFLIINSNEQIISRVGTITISDDLVQQQMAVDNAYGIQKEKPYNYALIQLLRAAMYEELARQYIPNYEKMFARGMKELEEHADKTTKAPEILNAVKDVFKDDKELYIKWYLGAQENEIILQNWFSQNPDLHADERQRIELAYKLALNEIRFLDITKRINGTYWNGTIKEYYEIPESLLQFNFQNTSNPLYIIAVNITDDELYSNIIENEIEYTIFRRIDMGHEDIKIESLTIQKHSFNEWFDEFGKSIEITIYNNTIKEQIQNQYPNVWWLNTT